MLNHPEIAETWAQPSHPSLSSVLILKSILTAYNSVGDIFSVSISPRIFHALPFLIFFLFLLLIYLFGNTMT